MERNSRKLIRVLERDGWRLVSVTGSHHHFEHSTKPGKITVTHPRKDIPIGLARAIYRQAGLPEDTR